MQFSAQILVLRGRVLRYSCSQRTPMANSGGDLVFPVARREPLTTFHGAGTGVRLACIGARSALASNLAIRWRGSTAEADSFAKFTSLHYDEGRAGWTAATYRVSVPQECPETRRCTCVTDRRKGPNTVQQRTAPLLRGRRLLKLRRPGPSTFSRGTNFSPSRSVEIHEDALGRVS